jgi:hypothetical protein
MNEQKSWKKGCHHHIEIDLVALSKYIIHYVVVYTPGKSIVTQSYFDKYLKSGEFKYILTSNPK